MSAVDPPSTGSIKPPAPAHPAGRGTLGAQPAGESTSGRSELSDAAVVSRSWGMAFATLISRITGFIRIVLLAALLGAGVVQCILRGQPVAQSGGRPCARSDVHRDLRAGTCPCGARRRRRRRGIRAPAGDTCRCPARGDHRAVGGGRPATGAAHARQRSPSQPTVDHRLCISAVAPGDLLRTVVGVHGYPEQPERLRRPRLGAGGEQHRGDSNTGCIPARAG